ncbi:MAG: U32 family peptidase [Tissierellia bacterium]|nr:U32 family peptidase [Tissierellia bacterium]
MTKPELLAPAGDLEKLKTAIIYGADAVYLGGEAFGLRKASKNFSLDEINEGVIFAHKRGKKVHITLNIVPHNEDMIGLEEYVKNLHEIGVDAVLISDPGMYMRVKNIASNLPIHISTQASVTNSDTINFWKQLGAKRIVLARELSLNEIKNIRRDCPDIELESFVHGAMCMAYSGRCLLSNYMTGRDSNRGDCAHPCRYKYHLVEEKRPGEYFEVIEADEGSFIMNSKDLCMIEHLPRLIEAGIDSLKIEGRVKSQYYVATVVRAYRMALDDYLEDPKNYKFDEKYLNEIKKASYRDFTTGFYFEDTDEQTLSYTHSSYIRDYDFIGIVKSFDKDKKLAKVEQRNKFSVGDHVEVFGPKKDYFTQTIDKIYDENMEEIESAPHPQQTVYLQLKEDVDEYFMLRRRKEEK